MDQLSATESFSLDSTCWTFTYFSPVPCDWGGSMRLLYVRTGKSSCLLFKLWQHLNVFRVSAELHYSVCFVGVRLQQSTSRGKKKSEFGWKQNSFSMFTAKDLQVSWRNRRSRCCLKVSLFHVVCKHTFQPIFRDIKEQAHKTVIVD